MDIPEGAAKFKCGCTRLFDSYNAWRAHRGHNQTPECSRNYQIVVEVPRDEGDEGARSAPPPPPPESGSGASPDPGDDEPDDEAEAAAAKAGGPAARDAGQVQEPRQPGRKRKDPVDMGWPDPSKFKEVGMSFPVICRFAYDGFRSKYPLYRGTFNEWAQECMWLSWKVLGLHPAVIWTRSLEPQPPDSLAPFTTNESPFPEMEESHAAA
jgi:hypothetical protein